MQVYSLDWDRQYLEDEAVLQAAGGYNANDYQLMEPLLPGQPLWADLPPPPEVTDASAPQPVPPEGDSAALLTPGSKYLTKFAPVSKMCRQGIITSVMYNVMRQLWWKAVW